MHACMCMYVDGYYAQTGGWAASLWSSRNISHIIENEMANETSDKPDEVSKGVSRGRHYPLSIIIIVQPG